MRMRSRSAVLFALLLVGGMAALVAGAGRIFPGPPTDTDPRANTPNDPDFDKAEPDDPDKAVACPSGGCGVFDEQHRLFGFAPEKAPVMVDTAVGRRSCELIPGAQFRLWRGSRLT